MVSWKLTLHEYSFNCPRVEQISLDNKGLPTFSLKYNNGVPFKIVYESEDNGGDVIEIKAFSDPYLTLTKPGYFDVEHRKADRGWDLPRFFKPEELEKWLKEKGVDDIPDFKDIHKKMGVFYEQVKNLKRPRTLAELHDSKYC